MFCEQFYCNCMDAALFAADTPAASSGSASQPNSSSSSQQMFSPISSFVSSSAQLSPDFLATIVQAVKAAFAAEEAPVVHSNIVALSTEHNVQRFVAISESSSLPDAQALGPHTITPFGHWINSSIALVLARSIFPARQARFCCSFLCRHLCST